MVPRPGFYPTSHTETKRDAKWALFTWRAKFRVCLASVRRVGKNPDRGTNPTLSGTQIPNFSVSKLSIWSITERVNPFLLKIWSGQVGAPPANEDQLRILRVWGESEAWVILPKGSHAPGRSVKDSDMSLRKKYNFGFHHSDDFWHAPRYFSWFLYTLNFQKSIGFTRLKNLAKPGKIAEVETSR